MTIYATPFSKTTKECLGPSVPLPADTMDEARALFPQQPVVITRNTIVYEQVGDSRLCVSWIRFSK